MKKVALVTGAGRGIGLGIARCLAAGGCDIVVGDIHEEATVKDALAEIETLGADVLYCRADVSDKNARAGMLAEIKQRFGRLPRFPHLSKPQWASVCRSHQRAAKTSPHPVSPRCT